MSKKFDRNECINKLVMDDKPVNLGWTDAELQEACGCKGACSAQTEAGSEEIKMPEAGAKKVTAPTKAKKAVKKTK